ncbi:Uncharacterised protein [Kingella denitrificans]|uniref:Uncharacterized protein n=1 Tax=Kingella denitrificans ATCC 33394 TaxID=888741 RepID=F0EYB0_9NEIS|nr:hypothetical protein [Kingella denitrificans]EGC17518.1 hypothetical protein HMPREF9098_0844 [Kingella denitrificans ATCC 33394]QQB41518.1 hypothetical protein I6I17_08450 [Kingella denitrificans]STR12642.1 Uncharacterised protein [Kingella denitrificans]
MDTSIYRQEYARFTDWLEESGNDVLPSEIQAALWQGWLARASQQEKYFRLPAACGKPETPSSTRVHHLIARELLNRLRQDNTDSPNL